LTARGSLNQRFYMSHIWDTSKMSSLKHLLSTFLLGENFKIAYPLNASIFLAAPQLLQFKNLGDNLSNF